MALPWLLLLLTVILSSITPQGAAINNDAGRYAPVKTAAFKDPNINYYYKVTFLNATSMSTEATHRSMIQVSRLKLDAAGKPASGIEYVQTLKFHPTLVDFDLLCQPTYCYLVAVTSRTKLNVELYAWQRTQFDLMARRDSFSKPSGVRLFKIQNSFYIVLSQEQLHLSPQRLVDYETKFIGCALLKFAKGYEHDVKYHQFIRLPFDPLRVVHYVSGNSNNVTHNRAARPNLNHYIVFSVEPDIFATSGPRSISSSFMWSPLNDYFWPYRLPRDVAVDQKVGVKTPVLKFPSENLSLNVTRAPPVADSNEPVESCFYQLQKLLIEREQFGRRLIDSSRSLWRSVNRSHYRGPPRGGLSNITAQVIVHGNVIVRGSMVESPQITMLGHQAPPNVVVTELSKLADSHSPAIVDNRLRQASFKLRYMRDKLSRAVLANAVPNSTLAFNSRIRFFGPINANRVVFRHNGIANSDVRLNGIPFKQLEHELVGLSGSQDIAGQVVFRGDVVADVLEIHGLVNRAYLMKDALDVLSNQAQIIETHDNLPMPRMRPPLEFASISVPELILAHNATINDIRLDDFITRDGRPQTIFGTKTIDQISCGKLSMADSNSQLNGFNIARLANNAIRLHKDDRLAQIINAGQVTFTGPVSANRLIFQNLINQEINITRLIEDSVKTFDVNEQHISGLKIFQAGLKVNHLNTEGSINDVKIDQIFNLNSQSPLPEFGNHTPFFYSRPQVPVAGEFIFRGPVTIKGNMNAGLINDFDVARHAVRRVPPGVGGAGNFSEQAPQIIHGMKRFVRPIRVLDEMRLVDSNEMSRLTGMNQIIEPLVNGLNIRRINEGIKRQFERPRLISIENLEIEGNLNLRTAFNSTPSPSTLGNYGAQCPLESLSTRLVLGGNVDQVIETPVYFESLRARSIFLEPGALNGMNFPQDFVLRTPQNFASSPSANYSDIEPVFGRKTFQQLHVASPLVRPSSYDLGPEQSFAKPQRQPSGITIGPRTTINDITFNELQQYMSQERLRNSTGETIIQTLTVHGNLYARRINGQSWPDDILLKSIVSRAGPSPSPYMHRRIYSPLIFTETSALTIDNQLILRGPIQLRGTLNGVNLTEFARQSTTYGDKDLLSIGRPIKNKIFAGGLTVTGEIRSQGLIDGVDFDAMRKRVVSIRPSPIGTIIPSQKIFMSDVDFMAPININYFNDIPFDQYLSRVHISPDGNHIRVRGRKIVAGELIANRHLFVEGLINGIDFLDLNSRAISLSPKNQQLTFNKTLTLEGDAFMDNLLIDEKDGVIDGIRLNNLLPINTINSNELTLRDFRVEPRDTADGFSLEVDGQINECQINCSLRRPRLNHTRPILQGIPQPTFTRPIPPPQPNRTRPVISALVHTSRPTSIHYEVPKAYSLQRLPPLNGRLLDEQLELLRKQIISLNMVRLSNSNDLVIGFIDSLSNDIGMMHLPDKPNPFPEYVQYPRGLRVLDQIDFKFQLATYHMSVGVSTDIYGANSTSVLSTLVGGGLRPLSVLPVEAPNAAKFMKVADQQVLFLLISQDYTNQGYSSQRAQCPRYSATKQIQTMSIQAYDQREDVTIGGIHVYIFHTLQNSSSLTAAYFDLYQTIDLPTIDSFVNFQYKDSSYVVAVSRATSKIFLLILRGYSGFQVVSYTDVPMLDYVEVYYTQDERPALLVWQTSGHHNLKESVII